MRAMARCVRAMSRSFSGSSNTIAEFLSDQLSKRKQLYLRLSENAEIVLAMMDLCFRSSSSSASHFQ